MILSVGSVRRWATELLSAAGLSSVHANDAADVFTRATLRGLGHHDLSYLPQRLSWLIEGRVNPRPHMEKVASSPSTEVWEGDRGLGEVLCYHVLRRAIALASSQGLGYAGVRHSNHFLAAEPYTQAGAEQGFLILIWSNTDAGMAFPGQASRQIGNNPMGWGLGTGQANLSADLCMAYASLGHLHTLASSATPAPPHWGRAPTGEPTTDASELLQGAVEPIGGHKGLALALLGEVLTGVLTGGPTLDEIAPGGGINTHNQMILAFDLDVFGGITTVEDRIRSLKTRAHHAGHTLRLPGDRSHASAQKALHEGILVPADLENRLRDWSERLGVSLPKA